MRLGGGKMIIDPIPGGNDDNHEDHLPPSVNNPL